MKADEQDTKHRWRGHEWSNEAEDRVSLFPSMSLSVLLPATPSLSLSVSVRIPLPAIHPLHINPSHQYLSLSLSIHPLWSVSSLSLSLFLPLLMCLLKLSGLLLTPSSSTQPAHSVLWDELWLILSLLPSPPSLVTYLPFCSSLQVSPSLSVALTSYNLCIVLCCVWGNIQKVCGENKSDWRIRTQGESGWWRERCVGQANNSLPSA